jgi:tetratricopeptide (TPR) repeat protein
MMMYIEAFDFEIAEVLYKELQTMEKLIRISPYNIEYKIYQLMYLALVERYNYDALCSDIEILDKIYPSLGKELQYLYMLVTGKHIYDFKNHSEGIERLNQAYKIKETSWINYRLGVACLLDGEPVKGIYYLERAMDNYEKSGWYNNALWCQNFLGMCYKMLKIYDKAEMHYNAVLKGSDYFNMDKSIWGIYSNFSGLYLSMGRYDESMKWSRMAMETVLENSQSYRNERGSKAAWQAKEEPMIGACDYIQACVKTGRLEECNKIFDKFLTGEFNELRYYKFLYFLYLNIHNFNEEIFYNEVVEKILPYYQSIGYVNLIKKIKLKLIEHLESKRKYKEANRIYKELMGIS